ncbi:hypothetical protein Tco_1050860, partial [Tanacetum coccineum]
MILRGYTSDYVSTFGYAVVCLHRNLLSASVALSASVVCLNLLFVYLCSNMLSECSICLPESFGLHRIETLSSTKSALWDAPLYVCFSMFVIEDAVVAKLPDRPSSDTQ